jgi:hypothetical protein
MSPRSQVPPQLYLAAAKAASARTLASQKNDRAHEALHAARHEYEVRTQAAVDAQAKALSGNANDLQLAAQAASMQNVASDQVVKAEEAAKLTAAELALAIAQHETALAAVRDAGGLWMLESPPPAPIPAAAQVTQVPVEAHPWVKWVALVALGLAIAALLFGGGLWWYKANADDLSDILKATQANTASIGKLSNTVKGIAKQASDAEVTANAAQKAVDDLQTEVDALKKCVKCGGKPKGSGKPKNPKAAAAPVAPPAPIAVAPCVGCTPKPAAIVRRHESPLIIDGKPVNSIKVVDNNDPSKQIARLFVDNDGGFIRIAKWDEKAGRAIEVVKTTLRHHVATGPNDQDGAKDLQAVEAVWPKVVKFLHLPHDCVPVLVSKS